MQNTPPLPPSAPYRCNPVRLRFWMLLFIVLNAAPALDAQTVFDWNGGAGNWNTGANWSTGTVPNLAAASVRLDNGNAASSAVTLADGDVTVGRLVVDAGDALTLSSVSSALWLRVGQGEFPGSGEILNNGTISLGSGSLLMIGNTDTLQSVTINGTGLIDIGEAAQSKIQAAAFNNGFTNNSTIAGAGSIGTGIAGWTNNGTISATYPANPLSLHSQNFITNNGLLSATAGAHLRNTTFINNAAGRIEAHGPGALVEIGATIRGGTLTTTNGGRIVLNTDADTLDGTVNPVTITAGSDVRITNLIPGPRGADLGGTIVVDGTLTIETAGSLSRLQIDTPGVTGAGPLILQGSGSLVMTNSALNVIEGFGGSTFTTNIPLTGSGLVGNNTLNMTNNSTVTANGTAGMVITPLDTFANNGLARALAGCTLTANGGTFINANGIFRADGPDAVVSFTGAEVQGGLLLAVNGGEVRFSAPGDLVNGSGSRVTIDGPSRVVNGVQTSFRGLIHLTDTLYVVSTGGTTRMLIPNNLPLAFEGPGRVTLGNHANNGIYGAGTAILTNRVAIEGSGIITATSVVNDSRIEATGTVELIMSPSSGQTVVNNPGGVVRASSSGGLRLMGLNGSYTNNGLFEASGGNITSTSALTLFTNYNATTDTLTGGTWRIIGPRSMVFAASPIVNNAAEIELSGAGSTFVPVNSIANNSGVFRLRNNRDFTTTGPLTNRGTLHVDGTAVLTTTGNLTQTGTESVLEYEMRALPAGSSYDSINVNGTATLAGSLRLVIKDNLAFSLSPGATVTVLKAGTPVVGAFANVVSGTRLPSANGMGSFLVYYGPGSPHGAANLVLTDYIPPDIALQIVSFSAVPGTGAHESERQINVVFAGNAGATYVLEASTDLVNWAALQTGTAAPVTGLLPFEVFEPAGAPRFFLRGRSP